MRWLQELISYGIKQRSSSSSSVSEVEHFSPQRVSERVLFSAAAPERQPRSEVWPRQPAQSRALPVHEEPPRGLLHPAAAGATAGDNSVQKYTIS